MRIVLVTQARFGSSRLPGKILLPIQDRTLLELHLINAGRSRLVTDKVVASTWEPESERIGSIAEKWCWNFYQGSTSDVLDRYYQAVKDIRPNIVVRITSDCPLVQPHLIDQVICQLQESKSQYVSTSLDFPDGVDVEAFTFSALEHAWREARMPSEREHVTPFIRSMTGDRVELEPNDDRYRDIRLTVDEPADLQCIRHLVGKLGWAERWEEYGDYILSHPEEFLNQRIIRNEGYLKSLKNDGNDGQG